MKWINLMVALLVLVPLVSADAFLPEENVPIEIIDVEVNGHELTSHCILDEDSGEWDCGNEVIGDVERGDEIKVVVEFRALEDAEDIEIEAELKGFEYSDYENAYDRTHISSVKADRKYRKTLSVPVPASMDRDLYALRIEISDRSREKVVINVGLDITTPRHSIKVYDVVFSPGLVVEAGKSLFSTVVVENFGEKDEDNVKISLSIPELGVSDTVYIDEVESDDEKTSKELYLRLPECAKPGDYQAVVKISYDNLHESTKKDYTITVIENEKCAVESKQKSKITIPDLQNIEAGAGETIYPIVISNLGQTSTTYELSAAAGSWASLRLSQNMVVVDAGETKIVYLYAAAAADASAGSQLISLTIKAGDDTVAETLRANVVGAQNSGVSMVKWLQVALIALVVLLVIVGLIVGFSRLSQKDDEESDDESYY